MTTHKNPTEQPSYPLIGAFVMFVIFIFVFFSKTAFRAPNDTTSKRQSAPTVTPFSNKRNINFDRPLLCNFTAEGASYSAHMDGSALAAVITEQKITRNIVVNGDCLYQWTTGETTGSKRCGVSSMVSMGKQLINTGLVNFDSFIPGLSNPLEQCNNVNSIDKKTFGIPPSVRFIESKQAE